MTTTAIRFYLAYYLRQQVLRAGCRGMHVHPTNTKLSTAGWFGDEKWDPNNWHTLCLLLVFPSGNKLLKDEAVPVLTTVPGQDRCSVNSTELILNYWRKGKYEKKLSISLPFRFSWSKNCPCKWKIYTKGAPPFSVTIFHLFLITCDFSRKLLNFRNSIYIILKVETTLILKCPFKDWCWSKKGTHLSSQFYYWSHNIHFYTLHLLTAVHLPPFTG